MLSLTRPRNIKSPETVSACVHA